MRIGILVGVVGVLEVVGYFYVVCVNFGLFKLKFGMRWFDYGICVKGVVFECAECVYLGRFFFVLGV